MLTVNFRFAFSLLLSKAAVYAGFSVLIEQAVQAGVEILCLGLHLDADKMIPAAKVPFEVADT